MDTTTGIRFLLSSRREDDKGRSYVEITIGNMFPVGRIRWNATLLSAVPFIKKHADADWERLEDKHVSFDQAFGAIRRAIMITLGLDPEIPKPKKNRKSSGMVLQSVEQSRRAASKGGIAKQRNLRKEL